MAECDPSKVNVAGSSPVILFMSTLEEEIYALQRCKEFIYSLLDPKQTPKVPKEIREKARNVVKHYPLVVDVFVEKYYNEKIVGSKATSNDYSKIEREIERYLDADDAYLPGNGTAEEACKPDLPQE
jgi:Tfp pilus assembly protein PilW